jgi:hypothetical protein
MALRYHVVWNEETINNVGNCKQQEKDSKRVCVQRKLIAKYPGIVEKVEVSLKFDASNFPGCILDDNNPLLINGQRVQLQLPSERRKLKYVDIAGVDVTKYFKASAAGELNTVEVNYLVRDKPSIFGTGKKNVGKLKLEIAVYSAEPGITPTPSPGPVRREKKFCMWHREEVEFAAQFCPYKGGERFETILTPETTKTCPNPGCPGKRVHKRAIYCEYCGMKQPGMTGTTTPTTTTTTTPPPST